MPRLVDLILEGCSDSLTTLVRTRLGCCLGCCLGDAGVGRFMWDVGCGMWDVGCGVWDVR